MPRRRALLGAVVGVAAALAGCSTDEGTDTVTDGMDAAAADPEADTSKSGSSDATTDDRDLREANVTGVAVESAGDGEYRFDVTLVHDDDGEDGYANWWQVETCDGERLGRRDLAHAHGTQAFTRSETVSVPDDAERVVVRGHDRTHGYGGQAMVVAVPDGDTTVVRQGPDREPVDCDAETGG